MSGVKQSSSGLIVEYVQSGILNGRLVPGQRLVEADLTNLLNVSRGPVREGFMRLEALGIVTQSRSRGARITTLTKNEAIDLLSAIEPLSVFIGQLAAATVAKCENQKQLDEIGQLLKPFVDKKESSNRILIQRRHFYETLIDIGRNGQISSILPTMRIQLLRLQIFSFSDESDRHIHLVEYSEISEAILKGNTRRTEKLMRAHIRRMLRLIRKLPQKAFLNSDHRERGRK